MLLRNLIIFAVITLIPHIAFSHDADEIEARIGFKDVAVLKNELRILGFPNAEIIKLGETAEIKLQVQGAPMRLEMDRRFGNMRVLDATASQRQFINKKMPALRKTPIMRLTTPNLIDVGPARERIIQPGIVAVPGLTTLRKEDCLPFSTGNAAVENIEGRWKIVDKTRWLFDFGSKQSEAVLALKIIKHYKMNKSCFVGRPNAPFSYMLTENTAPSGSFNGEDCLGFDRDTLAIKKIKNRWKIIQGRRYLFDFNQREDLAKETLTIIKKYGFTKSCFVGRPKANFSYLRK